MTPSSPDPTRPPSPPPEISSLIGTGQPQDLKVKVNPPTPSATPSAEEMLDWVLDHHPIFSWTGAYWQMSYWGKDDNEHCITAGPTTSTLRLAIASAMKGVK